MIPDGWKPGAGRSNRPARASASSCWKRGRAARRAADRVIGVDVDHGPALTLGARPADPHLVLDSTARTARHCCIVRRLPHGQVVPGVRLESFSCSVREPAK